MWTNIGKPTSSWVSIAKPSNPNYTNIPKPTDEFTIRSGMTTGLVMPLTYSTTYSSGNAWTNINKPTN